MSKDKINKSLSEYTDDDFSEKEMAFYESCLNSDEAQQIEEAQKKKVQSQKDKLIVIDGAQFQFGAHLATFKPLTKTSKIQGKLVGTIVERQPMNFTFADGFQVISLGQWEKYGTVKFQNNAVILQGSEISYAGQMPGSNTVETGKAKCIQSGQKKSFEGIDTTDATFLAYTTKPKVVEFYATDRRSDEIRDTEYEEMIYLKVNTYGLKGQRITIELGTPEIGYEYNGERLVDNTLKDYLVQYDEERIELKVVKP